MTVVPQQYTLQCILSGLERNFGWYYINTNNRFNCVSPHLGYSCSIENQTLYSTNNTIVHNLTVTWYTEEISSGIFRQSTNNGDHIDLCYERASEITVTGKYLYYCDLITYVSYLILLALLLFDVNLSYDYDFDKLISYIKVVPLVQLMEKVIMTVYLKHEISNIT